MPTMRPHGMARAHEDRHWPGPSHTYVSWKTSLVGLWAWETVFPVRRQSQAGHTPPHSAKGAWGSSGVLMTATENCLQLSEL